jgi:hypothetical protein
MKPAIKVSAAERKRFVLATDKDLVILAKIKQLKKSSLTPEDKNLINLIQTQLELDWRSPLIKALNKLSRKYKK